MRAALTAAIHSSHSFTMKPVKIGRLVSIVFTTGAVALLFGGCATNSGRPLVPHSHSGQMFRVQTGTVLAVREVVIEGSADTNVGLYGGAIMGGAAGSGVGGGGFGTTMASAVGAVGGMIAGRQVEKAVTKADGYEITVQLDDGKQIMVVQKQTDGGFMDGDRVRVMVGENTTKVMH
jgi:outer membrane lipoprotein SlyB